MAKDPAFLFYSSDFMTGVTDLTMEERGQYITLMCLQHQKGHLTEKTIRLSVGSVSVDVMKKFAKDEHGNFFNARLDEEIQKRLNFINSRQLNGSKGGRPKANGLPNGLALGKASEKLSENGNEIEDDYTRWTDSVLENNDATFEQMAMKEKWPPGFDMAFWVNDHLGLIHRYPKMRPGTQQSFRHSLLKHLRENKQKEKNGITKAIDRSEEITKLVTAKYGK